MRSLIISLLAFLCLESKASDVHIAAWGALWSRNMVSDARNLPDHFDLQNESNVAWKIPLGDETHSTPVAHDGRIYIGTNNANPRDPRRQGDRGVLFCVDQADGELLWQLVVPKRTEDRFFDWPKSGISSPATIEGERVYIVDNRGNVLCLDVHGLQNGNDGPFQEEASYYTPKGEEELPLSTLDADIIWQFNMTTQAGIWSHDASHSSIMIRGDLLYLNTGTGVDNTHVKIRTPDAPSLIVLNKKTGAYVAREKEGIAPRIFHCTWSAPALAQVGGQEMVLFAAGDGILYGFRPINACELEKISGNQFPLALEKIWSHQFDPDAPREMVHDFHQNTRRGPSNFFGMPVFHEGKIYAAGGGDLWWGKSKAWLKCIDPELNVQNTELVTTNPVWSYELARHVMSTPAVYQGMAFIADTGKTIHCVDLQTGKSLWTHDTMGDFWASPYVADGKVFIGDRNGNYYILAAEKEKNLLWQGKFPSRISATALATDAGIFVATMETLWLFSRK